MAKNIFSTLDKYKKLTKEQAQQLLDQFIHQGALTNITNELTDPQEEEKFRVLAADLLKKTTKKLQTEQKKHAGLQMILDNPAFDDLTKQGQSITNELFGETGVGGHLKMAGMGDLEKKFKQSIDKSLGFGNNVIVNWQNWYDNEIKKDYSPQFDEFQSLEARQDILGVVERIKDRGENIWSSLDINKIENPAFAEDYEYKPQLSEGFLRATGYENQKDFIEGINVNFSNKTLEELKKEGTLDDSDVKDFKRLIADQLWEQYKEESKNKEKQTGVKANLIPKKKFFEKYFPDVLDDKGNIVGKTQSYKDLKNDLEEKIKTKDEELATQGYEVEFGGKKYMYSADFMRNFIDDYINPRFNYSKSMAEFKDYLDVSDTGETLLSTQTVATAIKEYGEKTAKMYLDYLQTEGEGEKEFNLEEMKKLINKDMIKQMKNDKEGYSGNVFMNFVGPDQYVDLVLDQMGIKDPTSEKGKEQLKELGLTQENSLDDFKSLLKEQLTGLEAYEIREKLKSLVKEGKVPAQLALGIEYIQREQDKEFGKEQQDKTNDGIYQMFKKAGYQGEAEDLFKEDFMEGFDAGFISSTLSGKLELSDDPQVMMAQTEGLFKDMDKVNAYDDELYNVSKANKPTDLADYYKTFGQEFKTKKASDAFKDDDLMGELKGMSGFTGISFGQMGYF